jgi:ABC-type branched-subunit amino acid transport system substrate-binding protein
VSQSTDGQPWQATALPPAQLNPFTSVGRSHPELLPSLVQAQNAPVAPAPPAAAASPNPIATAPAAAAPARSAAVVASTGVPWWVLGLAAVAGAALVALLPRAIRLAQGGGLTRWLRPRSAAAGASGPRAYAAHLLPGTALILALALLAAVLPGIHLSSTGGTGTTAAAGTAAGSGAQAYGGGPGSTSGGPAGSGAASPGAPGTTTTGGASGASATAAAAAALGTTRAGGAAGGRDPGATYQGVTSSSVLLAAMYQQNTCGGANPAQMSSAYGIQAGDPGDGWRALEQYFNTYGLADYHGTLPADIAANVGNGKGFWGRKVTHISYDDGGFTCPDQARAVATKAVEQDKVFGAIKQGTDGVEQAEASIFARNKLFFTGIYNTSPETWQPLVPYVWDGYYGTGVDQMTAMGSFACRDYKGGKMSSTGDPTLVGNPRKFGAVYVDLPEVRNAMAILRNAAAKCGIVIEEKSYPLDLSQSEQQATTIMSSLHQDGVTSILNLIDFVNILPFSQAATAQQYFPEWINSSYLLQDQMTFLHTFWDAQQVRNVAAVTPHYWPTMPDFEHTDAAKAWAKMRPGQAEPANWEWNFDQWLLMAMGLAGAGRNLTPITMGQGLQRLCNPCPRGDPNGPLWVAYPGHPEMFSDFTVARYNANKPDPTSAPGSNGSRPTGYWDFPENGRRYIVSVNNPE